MPNISKKLDDQGTERLIQTVAKRFHLGLRLGIEDSNGDVQVADVDGTPSEVVSDVIFLGDLDNYGDIHKLLAGTRLMTDADVDALMDALKGLDTSMYSIGPGGGGRTMFPVINPQDANNILIPCDMASTFISKDGGESFLNRNLWRVPRFFFNPHDANIIYATTENFIYVSYDKGDTWEHFFPKEIDIAGLATNATSGRVAPIRKTTLSVPQHNWATPNNLMTCLYIHPTNPNIMYIMLQNGSYITYSTDGGSKWGGFVDMTVGGWGGNIAFDDTGDSSSALTDGIYAQMMIVGDELRMITRKGLYRLNATTRAAIAWENSSATGFLSFRNKQGVMVMRNGVCTVYMVTNADPNSERDPSYTRHILKSTDFGITWTSITTNFREKLTSPQGRSGVRSGWEGPNNFGNIVAAGNRIYVYATGGDWSRQGIARTDDEGATWVWCLDFPHQSEPSQFSAPFTEIGLLDIRDYPGFSWSGTGSRGLAVNENDPDHVIVTNSVDAWQTFDGGATWATVASRRTDDGSKPMPAVRATAFCTTKGFEPAGQSCLAVDPFDVNHRFTGWTDNCAFETFDGGHSWRNATVTRHNSCHAAAFDPHNEGVVLLGPSIVQSGGHFDVLNSLVTAYRGCIARSTDGGQTWTHSDAAATTKAANNLLSDPACNGLPSKTIPAGFVFDPFQPGVVYAALRGAGVYKSSDSGVNWERWSDGIEWQWWYDSATNAQIDRQGLVIAEFHLAADGHTLCLTLGQVGGATNMPTVYGGTGQTTVYIRDLQSPQDSWVEINRPGTNGDVIISSFDKDVNGVLYVGAHVQQGGANVPFNGGVRADMIKGGAYVSLDDGQTWRQIYDESFMTRIHVDVRHNDILYLTTYAGLVLVSYEGKNTTVDDWIPFSDTQKIFYGWNEVWEDPVNPRRIIVSTICGGTWSLHLPLPRPLHQLVTADKLKAVLKVLKDYVDNLTHDTIDITPEAINTAWWYYEPPLWENPVGCAALDLTNPMLMRLDPTIGDYVSVTENPSKLPKEGDVIFIAYTDTDLRLGVVDYLMPPDYCICVTSPSHVTTLLAETDAGTDIATEAVSENTVQAVMQTIWNKIRQLANVVNKGGVTMYDRLPPNLALPVELESEIPKLVPPRDPMNGIVTFYLAPDGDDWANTGMSPDSPFMSFEGINVRYAHMALDGIMINMAEGVYYVGKPSSTNGLWQMTACYRLYGAFNQVGVVGAGVDRTIIDGSMYTPEWFQGGWDYKHTGINVQYGNVQLSNICFRHLQIGLQLGKDVTSCSQDVNGVLLQQRHLYFEDVGCCVMLDGGNTYMHVTAEWTFKAPINTCFQLGSQSGISGCNLQILGTINIVDAIWDNCFVWVGAGCYAFIGFDFFTGLENFAPMILFYAYPFSTVNHNLSYGVSQIMEDCLAISQIHDFATINSQMKLPFSCNEAPDDFTAQQQSAYNPNNIYFVEA